MKKLKTKCDLHSCFLCRSSLTSWLLAIAANRVTYSIKKGEQIFREGEAVTGIFFVVSGTIKIHKRWGQDKELIIRFATNGAIAGHRGLGKSLRYPVSATALEPCSVCFVNLEFFEHTLEVNHSLTRQLLNFFAEELQESERLMRNLAHMPVKGRVARALLSLEQQFGTDQNGAIGIRLSRQDLASCVGSAYETVFRVMNELNESKLIRINGKDIFIRNEAALFALTSTAS